MMNYLGAILTGTQQYVTHRKSKGLGIIAFILIFAVLVMWDDWFKPIMDFTGVTDFAYAIGLVQSTSVMTFFVGYLLLAVVLYLLCIIIFFVPLVQVIFLVLPQPIQIILFAPVIIIGLIIINVGKALGLYKEKEPVEEDRVYTQSELRLQKMIDELDYSGDTMPRLPFLNADEMDGHRIVEYRSLSKAEQAEFDKHDKYTFKANGFIVFMRNKNKPITQEQVVKRFNYASFVPFRAEHFVVAFHPERRLWAFLTKLNHGLGKNEVIYQMFLPEWNVHTGEYDFMIDTLKQDYTNRPDMTGIAQLDEFTDFHTFKGPQFEMLLTQIGQWEMQRVIRQVQLEVADAERKLLLD